MLQLVPLLVAVDGDRYEITLPFVSPQRFIGPSPSRLYDDAALHVMERVFESPQHALPDYVFCPETLHRRVRVDVRFPDDARFEATLSVVLRRWPEEGFFEATIPRLGLERFAVSTTRDLGLAVGAMLRERAGTRSEALRARLEAAVPRGPEYLDVIEVDLDLPTVLPRTVERKKPKPARDPELAKAERAKRRRQTPPATLLEVGVNLVHRALDGDAPRVVGRDALIEAVRARLARPGAAVLLVGPPGVGKSAILGGVIARMAADEPRLHARSDAWLVDANRILSGMSRVGQWEARVARMVEELSARDDVLVVEDLPSLVFAGRTIDEETNVAGFLEPHLARRELRVIGECTPERLEAARDHAPGFFACFSVVHVEALDEVSTLRALLARVRDVEARGIKTGARVRVASDVPAATLALARRFGRDRALPGGAVELLDRLAAEGTERAPDALDRRALDREALVELFASQSGLPRFVLWEDESRPHAEVLAHFDRRIVAQPEASAAAADLVTTLSQGLGDPKKPIASMLLVGPTGVGKTETAKALAEYLFGDARRLVRFDMSELSAPGSAARLFGDAWHPDGELTRRIRQRPFAVILLDEIEKAHSTVFDALLGVLGEGRLTSADGRTTDFTNTIVLMTSNLGVREADAHLGFEGSAPDRSGAYLGAARAFFRPELFNRIDRVVAFRPLGRDAMRPLVERALLEIVSRRGLRRSGVLVDVEEDVAELLVRRGFDPRYGARALQRAVEQELVVPLARRLAAVPATGTTRVGLHRAGDGVGLEVWSLDEPAAAPADEAPVTDYAALVARMVAVRARMDGEADRFARTRALASEELARYSRGALEEAAWPRFDAATRLIEQLAELEDELARYEHEVLEETHFEVSVDVVEDENYRERGAMATAVSERAVHRVTRQPPRAEVDRLRELSLRAAELAHRARALEAGEQRRLVRVLPSTRDPQSRWLARALAEGLERAWRSFGELSWWARGDGGWARVSGEAIPEDGAGLALAVRGFGLDAVVDPELGFHLATHHVGPDVVTGLVRVEDVGLEGEPRARLDALDEAYAAFVEARRAGDEGPHPRGPLRVVRRFHDGRARDPATGLPVRLGALAEDLERVLRHRLRGAEG